MPPLIDLRNDHIAGQASLGFFGIWHQQKDPRPRPKAVLMPALSCNNPKLQFRQVQGQVLLILAQFLACPGKVRVYPRCTETLAQL